MEWVGAIAFGFLFIIVPVIEMRDGFRCDRIGISGWGTFERATMPRRFWIALGFHVAVMRMGIVLVIRACSK